MQESRVRSDLGGDGSGVRCHAGVNAERASSPCPVLSIGVIREGPLHAAVTAVLARAGVRSEVPVGRFVIDLVRADGELVEVYTGGSPLWAQSLMRCSTSTGFALVHPVAGEGRIVRVDQHREVASVRQSPKRDTAVAVFDKLVAFPSLLTHPNFTIEVLLLREYHVRAAQRLTSRHRTRGSRRASACRGARPGSNFAAQITSSKCCRPFRASPVSTRDLSALLGCNMVVAQRTAYCLRMIKIVESAGERSHT
jgi:hypothetical protein